MVMPAPWPTYFQSRKTFWAASAAIQVAMAKYMPFIRNSTGDSSAAISMLAAMPSRIPAQKGRCHSVVTIATEYPAMPMYSCCPRLVIPAKPPSRFQASPRQMYRKICIR